MICGASTNTHLARLPFGQPNGGAAALPYRLANVISIRHINPIHHSHYNKIESAPPD